MRKLYLLVCCSLLAASALAQTKTPAPKAATGAMATMTPLGSEKWADIPAAVMVGTPALPLEGKLQMAVVQGNPALAGRPYTLRISCSDGVKVAPHWHPTVENVTVIKGTFKLGMGARWDASELKELPTGGFLSAPARMPHFAACQGDTVLQIHGMGPFVVNFVPAGKAASAK